MIGDSRDIVEDRVTGSFPGADDCARPKPHPEPVLNALGRLGAAPAVAIYVGDSPHDIAAGNAAGVATVAVLWGACSVEALQAANPQHVVTSVDELLAIVQAIARSPARGSQT